MTDPNDPNGFKDFVSTAFAFLRSLVEDHGVMDGLPSGILVELPEPIPIDLTRDIEVIEPNCGESLGSHRHKVRRGGENSEF
jgi:hypothetical protein